MPPAAYALASDTLIGVIRTWVLARHPGPGGLAGEVTVLAVTGGVLLWLLRLSMAPASTLAGLRAWVLQECPVAPGRRAASPAPAVAPAVAPDPVTRVAARSRGSGRRRGTKTARFLALVTDQHGPLSTIPIPRVSRISAAIAPQVGLNAGAARTALRKAVLAARNGDPR